MQNNFNTFRPEIKDVKVKKVNLIDNTYHVFGSRIDKRDKCCQKKMNIHDYRTVNIKSLSYGNKKVILQGNASKEKYQLAIYDADHKLIDILKDRKSSTIKKFLLNHSDKIKRVSIDMFMQFRNVVNTYLPNADIVADKYHVIRQANWMIRDVRIRLFNSDKKYKEYKKYWKLIAKSPNGTFSNLQKKRLNKLMKLSKIFSKAYELRKKFFSIFEEEDTCVFNNKLENLILELKESEIKECMKLGETLCNWNKEIKNIQKYNINNGFVERKNNKIKAIKRISYGIKKFDNLKKLIQLRIS